jgi:biofilm PGA synthesis protein PgaA
MKLTRIIYQLAFWPLVIICFPCSVLITHGFTAAAGASQPKVLPGDRSGEGYRQALDLIRQGKTAEAMPLLEAAWRKHPDNTHLLADYLSALVWLGLYGKAIQLYTAQRAALEDIQYLSRNMAKAYYETGDYRQAQTLYGQAFTLDHSDAEALKGLVFASCKLTDYQKAIAAWLTAYQKKSLPPHTLTALKFYLIQHMGAPSLARQYARAAGIKDRKLLVALTGDLAAEHIKWEEYGSAQEILKQQLLDDPDNFRARADYIVALRQQHRMKEVVEQYRILEKAGRPVPYWVTESVADALFYLKQPEEAVRFYQLRLEQNPLVPFPPSMGLFYAYSDMREWDRAARVWDQIADLLNHYKLNYLEKNEALQARGWSFIDRDKLQEAQNYFEASLEQAGLNPGFRAGLGYTFYYRGWPRRALEQFQIARNVGPEDILARTGEVLALNDLNHKCAARNLAAELYRKYPYDLRVQDTYETLRVEDMPLAWGDARFIQEWPGVTEYRFRGGITGTVTPIFKVFTEVLHLYGREETNGQKFISFWDRWGFGFNWVVLPPFTLTQSVSWDYLKGGNFGSYTKIAWQVNDQFRAAASYNSFNLDIPLRALATGVVGKTARFDLKYTENELRDYGLIFISNWLSDGNYNPALLLGFDQNVINHPDWKLRIAPQFSYVRYSNQQVPYFSPNFEYSLTLNPSLQIVHYERYDKNVRSNIKAEIGLYKQSGFNFYPLAGITYEQKIQTSKTFELKWSVGYLLRVYDGNYTNAFETYFLLNKKF